MVAAWGLHAIQVKALWRNTFAPLIYNTDWGQVCTRTNCGFVVDINWYSYSKTCVGYLAISTWSLQMVLVRTWAGMLRWHMHVYKTVKSSYTNGGHFETRRKKIQYTQCVGPIWCILWIRKGISIPQQLFFNIPNACICPQCYFIHCILYLKICTEKCRARVENVLSREFQNGVQWLQQAQVTRYQVSKKETIGANTRSSIRKVVGSHPNKLPVAFYPRWFLYS